MVVAELKCMSAPVVSNFRTWGLRVHSGPVHGSLQAKILGVSYHDLPVGC